MLQCVLRHHVIIEKKWQAWRENKINFINKAFKGIARIISEILSVMLLGSSS